MAVKTRIMLYVDDVAAEADFWQKRFHAEVVEVNQLTDDASNIILMVSSEVELSLFDKAFVREHSPEVSLAVPSLMFFRSDFDDLHRTLPTAGAITQQGDVASFNFVDPEGNYFVVAQG